MKVSEYNEYKERYRSLSDEEKRDWHSRVFRGHPDQDYFDAVSFKKYFHSCHPKVVLEIGGWRGGLASFALDGFEIDKWVNYEVCVEAANSAIVNDDRYVAIPEPLYEVEDGLFDSLVMSHSIEHMTEQEVTRLILSVGASKISSIYIDTPLPIDRGRDWKDCTDFHVLTCSWNDLDELIRNSGFSIVGAHKTEHGDAKWYRK